MHAYPVWQRQTVDHIYLLSMHAFIIITGMYSTMYPAGVNLNMKLFVFNLFVTWETGWQYN
jgi:hypothetical protein